MTQPISLRTIACEERGAVLDLLGEWISRDFFARYFEHDPAFRDDLCFVAVAGKQIVSTLQVFEKKIRVEGATLRVGGVGNVYTAPAFRARGIASALLHNAIAAMERDGFDLSLLFAVRLAFYGHLGWQSHARHLIFLDPGKQSLSGHCVIEPFVAERDLEAVAGIYEAYSGKLLGTTVRDRHYWRGQLDYAGNPHEDFFVARLHGAKKPPVAYARGTVLYDYYVVMEHGYAPGHQAALAELVSRMHGREAASLPGTLTQLVTEPEVRNALTARGLTMRTVEDVFWMWRVISAPRLARKLSMTSVEVERDDFWWRLLPPERSVFWLSDRF